MRMFLWKFIRIPKKVVETHGETKKAKEYLMLADLMEFRFSDNS